jgi:hypothetical protein
MPFLSPTHTFSLYLSFILFPLTPRFSVYVCVSLSPSLIPALTSSWLESTAQILAESSRCRTCGDVPDLQATSNISHTCNHLVQVHNILSPLLRPRENPDPAFIPAQPIVMSINSAYGPLRALQSSRCLGASVLRIGHVIQV